MGVLRCFASLRYPAAPMNSVQDDPELPGPGCPIRKSPDQSLLSGSPKLIAASHALHRLLAPRHSPSALNSLTTMQERPCACTRRLPVHTLFSCQRTPETEASVTHFERASRIS